MLTPWKQEQPSASWRKAVLVSLRGADKEKWNSSLLDFARSSLEPSGSNNLRHRETFVSPTPFSSSILHYTKAKRHSKGVSFHFVRVRRIELLSQPWQGRVLPLNHTRDHFYLRRGRRTGRALHVGFPRGAFEGSHSRRRRACGLEHKDHRGDYHDQYDERDESDLVPHVFHSTEMPTEFNIPSRG